MERTISKTKKFIYAILFTAIVLTFIGGVNYYVDSYAHLRVTYLQIAERMQAGSHVVGLDESRYNERYLALANMQLMEEAPRCIWLGSSRSAVYGKETVGEDSFYNFSLSGGTLQDYYGVIGYLDAAGKMPKKVIMEVNGSLLYDGDDDARYTYLQDGIDYLKKRMEGENATCDWPNVGRDYLKIFDLDYFKYNMECLTDNLRFACSYTKEPSRETTTKLIDGSVSYSDEVRNRSVEYVKQVTGEAIANKSLYKVEGFECLSDTLTPQLCALALWLQEQGVEVSFFFPPYSEPIYTYLCENEKEYAGVFATEQYVADFARENHITLYGSFSPAGCDLSPEDLFDTYHIKQDQAGKAFYVRD
jgi:hypothetical protein